MPMSRQWNPWSKITAKLFIIMNFSISIIDHHLDWSSIEEEEGGDDDDGQKPAKEGDRHQDHRGLQWYYMVIKIIIIFIMITIIWSSASISWSSWSFAWCEGFGITARESPMTARESPQVLFVPRTLTYKKGPWMTIMDHVRIVKNVPFYYRW